MTTIEEVRAAAERAKASRPTILCDIDGNTHDPIVDCGRCDYCLGAQRAVEDVAQHISSAIEFGIEAGVASARHRHSQFRDACKHADHAARIESYFGPPGPVAEFAAKVREFVEGGK